MTSTAVSSCTAVAVDRISMDHYRRLLEGGDLGEPTVYHEPAWLEAVGEGMGFAPTVLGLWQGGELVGALPGFTVRKYGVRLFGSPLRGSMTPYAGWLTRSPLAAHEIVSSVGEYCVRSLGCSYLELGFFHSPSGLEDGDLPHGWNRAGRETYLLDLSVGEAALWSNLGQRGRAKVRKAERMGVTIEEVTDRAVMSLLHPMVEAAYARHHAVSPHPERLFLALFDRLVPKGLMTVFAARREGRVIAMALVPHDRQQARCMSVASLPEFHGCFPNNLLHWHVIAWACRSGLAWYDFAGKGQPSIDRFKETFGPTVHAYAFYWRASPAVAWARALALRAWPRLQALRYRLRQIGAGGAGGPGAGGGPADPGEEV